MSTSEYQVIDVDAIRPNPEQPRKQFDDGALAELAASIKANGLLQAITVRQIGRTYLIVAGERRWRALQLAGITTTEAKVLRGIGRADAYTLSVIENLNRRDVTPMEEAGGYAQMREDGKTVQQIASLIGRTPERVTQYLELLDLTPAARELLDGGGMKVGLAWYVSRLSAAGQQVAIRKYLGGEFKSDTDASAFCTAVRAHEAQDGLFGEPITEDERRAQAAKRRALHSKMATLASAYTACTDLAAMDPAEVAAALAGDGGIGTYRDQLALMVAQANKALAVLRKADAAIEATTALAAAV